MKVIFMGSPAFALPTLRKLIESKDHDVVAVFTQKPKPKGRGMQLTLSPVHDFASNRYIPVYNPESLRDKITTQLVSSINADVIIVVAYGFIVPSEILHSKQYGCLNLHPSKLPKYRGAAPMQRCIINGDNNSAICIIQMNEGLDTGDILLQENIKLDPFITLTELYDKCSQIGANLILKTLDNIENLAPIKQLDQDASYAHKLTKEEARIDWTQTAFKINCKIRGMNPWPGTYFYLQGKLIKLLDATPIPNIHNSAPGTMLNDDCDIACGNGSIIKLNKIIPQSKSKISAKEYFRDRVSVGQILL